MGHTVQAPLAADVMDAVRQRQAPQLEPRSRYSVTLCAPAKPRNPTYIHNPCTLVVQDGDSAHGGPGSDLCGQTCSGPESTYLLPIAGRTVGAEYLRVCCPVSVIMNLSLQAKAHCNNVRASGLIVATMSPTMSPLRVREIISPWEIPNSGCTGTVWVN